MIKIGNTDISTIYVGDAEVQKMYLGSTTVYEVSSGGTDYSKEYFTIEAISAGTVSWAVSGVSYSVNDSAWNTWDSGSSVSVSVGDKVRFKSDANTSYKYKTISNTGDFKVYGNIMSLLYGDNFSGQTSFPTTGTSFAQLFQNISTLTDAENLILPATALTSQCYSRLMLNTKITKSPVLPATTLAGQCYEYMLAGTLITEAPELPVTTLATGCYLGMFSRTPITTAPTLPATSLAGSCYEEMFYGCTSLVNAPALTATTAADSCYNNMFSRCRALVNAPKIDITTAADYCFKEMFYGCTSLVNAPELNVVSVNKRQAYQRMFYNCSNLNYIKCLAESQSGLDPFDNWLYGVAATGTFVKSPNATFWTTGASGIPNNWTVVDA